MINKATLMLIAAIAASAIALPTAASAQSSYTTGTAASSAAAGLPTSQGSGSSLYAYTPDYGYARAYVPDYGSDHAVKTHHRRRRSGGIEP